MKKNEQNVENSLWRVADVAKFLNISTEAVRMRTSRGQLPYKKVNGTVYYSETLIVNK